MHVVIDIFAEHILIHALSEHRNPLLVSISLKSSDVPVFWRYVPETNHGLPILSFCRRLHLYFWTMCIWSYFDMIDAHIFRAMFQVNVNCWYLLERVQFDTLSNGHLCSFANKWPLYMNTHNLNDTSIIFKNATWEILWFSLWS